MSHSSLSSIRSAESLASATSTSSNMTAMDDAASKKKWEEIAESRKKMNCKIDLIKVTLKKMSESLERQKNVNKTVKDGVKDIVIWIEREEEDHQEIVGKETVYKQKLQTGVRDRQEDKVLNRAQAQIMTDIVLESERTSLKSTSNPKDDDKLEKRRAKKPLLDKENKKKQKKGEL